MYCIQVEKSHSNINLKAIEGLYESACAADADNQGTQ